jgi:hypothetical protein
MRLLANRARLIPLLAAVAAGPVLALDWLKVLPLENGAATLSRPASGEMFFLRFGAHAYAPAPVQSAVGNGDKTASGKSILVAPFQQLWIEPRPLPAGQDPIALQPGPATARDAFWDQLITADPAAVGALPRYAVIETGDFGSALPDAVRRINLTRAEAERQQTSLVDPVIPAQLEREIPWTELAAQAYPLDFQKVLLASPHDPSPGFAYQNGQWFTTWPSRDLPEGCQEDHWFAPALLINDTLVRPAPLSAHTAFVKTAEGVTLPLWTLEWRYRGITVRQRIFSARPAGESVPRLFAQFQLVDAPAGVRMVLGAGRRPSAHYWDFAHHPKSPASPRTPIPYFSVEPGYVRLDRTLVDAWGNVVLASAQPFTLEPLGPLEDLLVFSPDAEGRVCVQTPQRELLPAALYSNEAYAAAEAEFIRFWSAQLRAGARVRLPSTEWMERIDAWQSQVEAITRVTYAGRERLSYGAYFYQDYFGIEEAWPVVALAQWGRGDEARRQAEIMLEAENLDKTNVHHQSRNGAAPLAAATVARLTNDRAWLEQVSPVLRECALWTEDVRKQDDAQRPVLTRGLLPPHIYGGDVRDPATSLYATAACWRGMLATAEAFQSLGSPVLSAEGDALAVHAGALQRRLADVFREVTDRAVAPAFVPFALALPSLNGRNEGPYEMLTASRYGNYWNLFAPSFLELDFRDPADPRQPNQSVFDYGNRHGGLWAGLPRFYDGLDAAYAIGNLGYLLERSTRDGRNRPAALTGVQSFMLHASSRNGHTIPEVAGLFPERLQAAAYEQQVREAPWSFGMYDANRYLAGHISFTEPLGAVAGAALTLIRDSLLSEARNDLGLPDGGLVILPAVPADWLAEGKEIVLENMPTFYGTFSATIRSSLSSRREIAMDYRFVPYATNHPPPLSFRARFAPLGEEMQEISFVPQASGTIRARF